MTTRSTRAFSHLEVIEIVVVAIIDMLNDYFVDGVLADSRAELTTNIRQLVDIARQRSWLVVWVRQEFQPDLSDAFLVMRNRGISKTIAGTEGCKILKELEMRDTDIEIVKKRYSAFFRTNFGQILDQNKTERLILAGINSHACIRTTAIDAYQRDLNVEIPTDCVGSYDRQHHEISLAYLGKGIVQLTDLAQIKNNAG